MPEASFVVRINVEPALSEVTKATEAPYTVMDVVKASAEDRYTLSVAYPAMKADVEKAKDGRRDFAGPEAVEKACWNYMLKSRRVGLGHFGADGGATVVENYIYRGPDWVVKAPNGSTQVIKASYWLLGLIWDTGSFPLAKAGIVGGVSVEGQAMVRSASPGALAQLRS